MSVTPTNSNNTAHPIKKDIRIKKKKNTHIFHWESPLKHFLGFKGIEDKSHFLKSFFFFFKWELLILVAVSDMKELGIPTFSNYFQNSNLRSKFEPGDVQF